MEKDQCEESSIHEKWLLKNRRTRGKSVWGRRIVFIMMTFLVCCTTPAKPPGGHENDHVIMAESLPSRESIKPRYGGTLNLVSAVDNLGFDDAVVEHYGTYTLKLTNEDVWEGDWTRGAAGGHGSREARWYTEGNDPLTKYTGTIAESWDVPEIGTLILHIRRGVHWHNKPPVNGREVTADDVAFSIKRIYTLPTGYGRNYFPGLAATIDITTPDEYTVVVKSPPQFFTYLIYLQCYNHIFPREAVESFGDMNDWRNSIGTGPFILKNYITGTLMNLERNPNYWRENQIGPGRGDMLPYVDSVNIHVIANTAARIAAFRRGEIDIITLDGQDAREFIDHPEVQHIKYHYEIGGTVINMRTDLEHMPYSKKEVRQALSLAINQPAILDKLYEGEGQLLHWPVGPVFEHMKAYMPLNEMPASVQELFGYDKEKAEELLEKAGYERDATTGTRFETEIITLNAPAYTEAMEQVKEMWAQIGVRARIVPLDYETFTAVVLARYYDHMIYGWYAPAGAYGAGLNFSGNHAWNLSYVDDETANIAVATMPLQSVDESAMMGVHRELMPYLLEQAYVIQLPKATTYRFWRPWVRNYSGEWSLGYQRPYYFVKYIWIDEALKTRMGY